MSNRHDSDPSRFDDMIFALIRDNVRIVQETCILQTQSINRLQQMAATLNERLLYIEQQLPQTTRILEAKIQHAIDRIKDLERDPS